MSSVITEIEGRNNISANLRRIMADRGLSQTDLSVLTGIPVMTINRVVRGLNVPSAVHLARVAEALDVSMDRLIGPPPSPPILVDVAPVGENLFETA